MDITAANATLTLAIPPIFPVPQTLQGFAADDVYDVPQIRSVETLMGVDGVLSGGFVYVAVVQRIMLQADSASNAIFDQWWSQMQATRAVYVANGVIRLPSIQTKFVQSTGYLTGYKPAHAARRVLQPREYEVTWNTIQPQPN